jgi:hypothetical protein
MRSRGRLIEVLESVNPNYTDVEGITMDHAIICRSAAQKLAASRSFAEALTLAALRMFSENAASPHIRELLTEALHYLEQDNG